jgi:hypothetical protein
MLEVKEHCRERLITATKETAAIEAECKRRWPNVTFLEEKQDPLTPYEKRRVAEIIGGKNENL